MIKKLEIIIAFAMLAYSVWFNLDLYKLEPTATTDPNDNNFQYGLVDRANQIWDYANRTCPKNLSFAICHLALMTDHWVPNWAQGYNLPFYYSHVPQIVIVGSYRLLHLNMSLFRYYHEIIYLLLCLFPISVFFGLRIIRLPWLIAGAGALIATHISTDGLYGLDPPSFLWRGWGLSSQLYAMMFLPPALAYGFRYFQQHKKLDSNFWLAVIFTILTTMGHLGIGMVLFLSFGVMAIASPLKQILSQEKLTSIRNQSTSSFVKLALLGGLSIFFLGYWIIPTFLSNNYHNISFWDPVWKFNSYGWKEVMIRFFNGDLLDFGRFPWLTLLTLVGVFAAASSYFPFTLLFVFWLAMYFGRTTWGGLMDLIPGMTEYHLSRFIVGVHLLSMFLIPIGLDWLSNFVKSRWFGKLILGAILLIVLPPVYHQTVYYNELNNKLIIQANDNAAKIQKDIDGLMTTLKAQPSGRVFAGRGGGWGKDFRIAETQMFMYLSTFGFNTVLWLPETWSPNSDTEQYFSEDQQRDYDLYNIRYVVAPPTQAIQPFWKEMKRGENWVLYSVPTSGYFTTATRTMVVVSDKQSFANLVRLWIQSPIPSQQLYPELRIGKSTGSDRFKIPMIQMIDEVTYLTAQNNRQNIWDINPIYTGDAPKAVITGPEIVDTDMQFKTTVKSEIGCRECYVILKQTYHPNWRATVDGKPVKPIEVFPAYIGIPLATSGVHEIAVWYQPSTLKIILLVLGITSGIILVAYRFFPLDKYWPQTAN